MESQGRGFGTAIALGFYPFLVEAHKFDLGGLQIGLERGVGVQPGDGAGGNHTTLHDIAMPMHITYIAALAKGATPGEDCLELLR